MTSTPESCDIMRDSPSNKTASVVLRYGVSVLSVATALLLTQSLKQVIFPTPLFFAAIVASTWFGGTRPGLLSVLLAAVTLDSYFIPATQRWAGELPYLIQFALPALLTCWFVKKRREAEFSLRAARDELEEKVQQRTAELRREIAERQRAEATVHKKEAELAHVNRVMTMGELTTSIAHEVNQPLMAVVVNGDACLQWLDGAKPNLQEARKAVASMIAESNRAGAIITRIRALSKKTSAQKTSVDLNGIIAEIIMLVNGELVSNDVVLETELASDLPRVLADRIQLQQVMLNLVMNAVEAMHGMTGLRAIRIASHVQGANAVLITVQDSGIGLPAQDIDRIFDAFFTTKPEGIGMGLSISRTIIEAHGGRLWAENGSPGAIFRFTVPRYALHDL